MRINFYLERGKKSAPKKTIWCYIRHKDDTLSLNTGLRVFPEYWDKNKKRADVRSTKDSIKQGALKQLNRALNKFEDEVETVVAKLKAKKVKIAFEDIKSEIIKEFREEPISFFTALDEFITLTKNRRSKSTAQKYVQLQKSLLEFQSFSGYQLSFANIDSKFYDKFYPFLITEKNFIDNTANKTISFLKAFLNWSIEREYTDNKKFNNYKISYTRNDVIYLTENELMDIYNLELNEARLSNVRDVFCFQCFTGQRYSDIASIDIKDIKNGSWRLRTQKTNKILEVPLNAYAISILTKYSDLNKPLPTISNQKMNSYLKELCELAGLDEDIKISKLRGGQRVEKVYSKYELISTHTARRTFITLSLIKGMKPNFIMEITGHTDYRMMKKYLGIAKEETRKSMHETWGSPIQKVR
ncbi:MAG: site-specific integrase [Candidatus Cloacimonetes bacterium]|nr:site-specific integrase [Candidatus Cloacimonadota bacterium]